MHFSSFSDFLAMGGYGFYVWLSYGLSFIAILLLIVFTMKEHSSIKNTIKKGYERQARIMKSKKSNAI